ncbi:hypothetical protein BO82DRAFT_279610 [Aspergillus uvarum CBS 121591]|uniref:Uncharacterized protein n=1 Tax=Aspergillus uvarum CBS 121591 TaxID=1448315 RepID=A0A319CI91_9EURO|nr:hypothetical protein BO82DRAFT_279610 [Aspergillus uvarum CBS 121591]PYH83521.1 hypothetical protein BO82DRAFT_279610 [Aspergillus uvarum CBS 121591]
MASARLRRAFRYPDDLEDDEYAREELDEEGLHRGRLAYSLRRLNFTNRPAEQERVIQALKLFNDRRNSEYSIIFAAIPLLSAAIYLPPMLSSSSATIDRCVALVSVLSLLATAHSMRYLPHRRRDNKSKGHMMDSNGHTQAQQLLPLINAASCILLVLIRLKFSSKESWFSTELITSSVPGAMLATVWVARRVMLSVDIKDLETLRYNYKGA